MPAETKELHIPASFQSLDSSRFRRLDDVTIGVFDCPHSTPKLSDHGPLVVRTQDIMTGVLRVEQAARVSEETYRERIDRAEPEFGDLLYSREGTYFGIAAEVPSGTRLCLGQRMVLIRPDRTKIDHRYLKYWLNSPQIAGHIHGFRDGSVAERLNLPVIRGLPIFLPELSEQRAIAETLSALDDKIEQNRRTGRALEGLARATFKAWFVDFEPVKAKAAGQTNFPGMPPAAFATLPDRLTDSPLGPVPQSWRISSIGAELKTFLGGTPSRGRAEFWADGTVPWINSGEVNKFPIIDPTALITPAALTSSSTKLIPARSTVIAITGATLGQVSILGIEACTNQSVVSVIGSKELPTEFIYLWVKENIDRLLATSTGAAQQHVNKNDVNMLPMLCPEGRVMDAYISIVGPVFDSVLHLSVESRKLATLRDYLLPRLLSGRVRVRPSQAEAKG